MPTCRASKQSEIDPIIRWRSYIDSLCWAKGSLNDSSYLAFLRAGSLGVDAQSVFDEVARRIKQAGDFVREAKLRSQIDRAYNFAGRQGTETVSELRHEWTGPRPIKPEFDPLKAEHFARCLPEEIDFDWLKSRSPEPLTNLSPGDFLSLLYAAGEQVLILKTLFREPGRVFGFYPIPSTAFGAMLSGFAPISIRAAELAEPRKTSPPGAMRF